jgi:hypothetical protein
MEKFSPEITYTPVISNHSTTIMRQLSPQGSSSVTLSTSSVVGPTEILIPPSVINLKKCKLDFSLLIAAPSAKCAFVNGNLNTMINRIVLYSTLTNAVLCDISSFEKYTSLVTPSSTEIGEYLTKPYMKTVQESLTGVDSARLNTVEDIAKSNLLTVNDTGSNVDIAPENPYLGRRQWYIGAATKAVALDVSLPFSSFKHSILSVDKNLYFNENLCLQIYWNNTDNFAFIATAVTDPVSGVASLEADPVISNIQMSLATEGNLAIVSQTIDKVQKEGITLPFSYPSVTRQSLTSASPSYTLQLTKAFGQRIVAIITAPFSQVSKCGANQHFRGTITQYNTFINSVALRYQGGFNTLISQDYWLANRAFLDRSVVQTIGEYVQTEWLHCDSFFGDKSLYLADMSQNDVDGLDVSNASSTWQIQSTLSASTAYTWVSIIIGQKVLSITKDGAYVM